MIRDFAVRVRTATSVRVAYPAIDGATLLAGDRGCQVLGSGRLGSVRRVPPHLSAAPKALTDGRLGSGYARTCSMAAMHTPIGSLLVTVLYHILQCGKPWAGPRQPRSSTQDAPYLRCATNGSPHSPMMWLSRIRQPRH